MDPNCPWTNLTDVGDWRTSYPQCDRHYVGPIPLEWGVNTGVCNISSWAQVEIQKMIDANRIRIGDNARDDGARILTDERYWVMEGRGL